MSLVENIDFTVLGADNSVYTNELTPVTAVPWPNRFEELAFPNIPINYSPENIIWDFGDGTKYTGISASHVYQWPGSYEISLIIINDSGEPVTSTTTYTISAVDMVPTQMEWIDEYNAIDIQTGKKIKPLQFNFKLSWQNYKLNNRPAPGCDTNTQHWMNENKTPGKWMCGDTHNGELPPPIYTFNMYASGSNSPVLDIEQYNKNSYGHLHPFTTFYSSSSALSSVPTNTLDITQVDSVTGVTGSPNTYELIYHAYNTSTNEFEQVLPDTPGAVFTGLSGTGSYYYYDNVPKNKTSRDEPIYNFVELDSVKLQSKDTVNKYNLPHTKNFNTKILKRNHIKSRVNEPAELSITSNGLPEFPINTNKWQNSLINFALTITDKDGFAIKDNSIYANIKIKLIEYPSLNPVSISEYSITSHDAPGRNYYIGSLNSATTVTKAQLSGSLTYTQTSGYTSDAVVGYINGYRPASGSVTETGTVYRMFHQNDYQYDSDDLSEQLSSNMHQTTTQIDTNGSISSITITNPGANLTGPPSIILTDPTGTGADLACTYDENTQTISDIKILNGGINYIAPVLTFISNRGATDPAATATVESNYECQQFAVQLPTDTEQSQVWGIETGSQARLLKFDSKNNLLLTHSLTTPPVGLTLDSTNGLWICESDKIKKINGDTGEVLFENDLDLTSAIGFLSNKNDDIYVYTTKNIHRYSNVDYTIVTETYTTTNNIIDVLSIHDDKIYILLDDNTICKTNFSLVIESTCSLPVPTGAWNKMTVGTTGNIYVADSDTLYEVETTGMTYTDVITIEGKTDIVSIIGDSRGYIWLIDNGNEAIYYTDIVLKTSNINTTPNTLEYGKTSYSLTPALPDGVATGAVYRAAGDWTGFHWLQKYGYIQQSINVLTGTSDVFSIHDKSGYINAVKYNENYDAKSTTKTYAIQPWLQENYTLWENVGYMLGDAESEPTTIGKLVYEKVSNFTNNNNDIDDCNIENIHNYSMIYDVDLESYNYNYPPTIKRLIDMFSIKHKRLFGEFDYNSNEFDMYTEYTTPDNRENLGSVLDFDTHILTPGDTIVAYEKFSKIYTPITVSYPTSGTVDIHGNIVNKGMDTDIVTTVTETYPLSAYSAYWQWDLVAPVTINGKDILNYYDFYSYNDTVSAPQVEGVINWSDPQTTLSPSTSSYQTWSETGGLVDNMIEHQLRKGLNLFNTCITSIEGTMSC